MPGQAAGRHAAFD